MMGTKAEARAAREILRGERQQTAMITQTEHNPVRRTISWAMQFVPGTKSSGVALPDGVARCCLDMSRGAKYGWPGLASKLAERRFQVDEVYD